MQITVKGKNVEVTPALKDYVQKRLERVARYFDHIISVDAMLSTERGRHIAEIKIFADGTTLRGTDKTKDMYNSIENVAEKLEVQIKKLKDKHIKKHLVESIRTNPELLMEEESLSEAEKAFTTSEIKTKRFSLNKPMLPIEAIKEMESSGYDFFVFLNAENERVNVVYSKKTGHGLIDPILS